MRTVSESLHFICPESPCFADFPIRNKTIEITKRKGITRIIKGKEIMYGISAKYVISVKYGT